MYCIAVINEKGGVAKTTTVISLGGALVEMGKEVLVIDLDPQSNLTLGFGIDPMKVRRTVADVLFYSSSIVSASRETPVAGLDIVPSNTELGIAERFLPVRQGYEYLLKNSLQSVTIYDYVLLDCPPSLGALTWNAMTAARLVIAPTLPEYFSAYSLRTVISTIKKIRSQTNADLEYMILITMMDRRNRIHRTLRDQLMATFGKGLLQTIIETDTKLRESTVAGLPITHYSSSTRSAGQYRELAQELVKYVEERNHQQD